KSQTAYGRIVVKVTTDEPPENAGIEWMFEEVYSSVGTLVEWQAAQEVGRLEPVPAPPPPSTNIRALEAQLSDEVAERTSLMWPSGSPREAAALSKVHDRLVSLKLLNGSMLGQDPSAGTTRRMCERTRDPSVCARLGLMLTVGHGVERSPRQATDRFRKLCRAGHQEACLHLRALTVTLLSDASVMKQTIGRNQLAKMCLDGIGDACVHLPRLGGEAAIDQIAVECRNGSGPACAYLVKIDDVGAVSKVPYGIAAWTTVSGLAAAAIGGLGVGMMVTLNNEAAFVYGFMFAYYGFLYSVMALPTGLVFGLIGLARVSEANSLAEYASASYVREPETNWSFVPPLGFVVAF
ncbi:MAG: hypothetical protein V3T05_13375, partial [Myxococcota bacterium]